MKTKALIFRLIICLIILLSLVSCMSHDDANGKSWSKEIAKTFMERYPDPMDFPGGRWSYPQGYMLMGIEKLWESTGDKKYYDYIMKFVDNAVNSSGYIKLFNGNSLDNMMAGATVVWAYKQTGLEKYKRAAEQIRRSFDEYPRTSDSLFWHGRTLKGEVWIDGSFMGQMFLTKYGKYVADSAYCFREAARQLIGMHNHLKKAGTGLMYHAWDEDHDAPWADKNTGLSPEVWSEGLGWYALTLVETLDIYPKHNPWRTELEAIDRELMKSLKNYQDPKTGLWFDIVDKGNLPDNFDDPSGSAMFLYALKKSVEMGLVGTDEFKPVIDKGYKGLLTKAQINRADNLVSIIDGCEGVCVQVDYDNYVKYKKKTDAKETIAGFLWGTWIVEKRIDNQLQKGEVFVRLPDFVTTPDGLAIAPDSNLVVACPNFADQSKPACLIKISKDGIVKKWIELPVLPETGVACPMGIAFGPDNDIFICDNQGWSGKPAGMLRGRILRLKTSGSNIDSIITVVQNMEHPNGIRVRDGYIYVTQSIMSKVKDTTGLLVSAVYRFGINDRNISLSNTLEDKNILTTFLTHNKFCQYGADGIVFDSKGNLYIGNFGDGTLYKITFNSNGSLKDNFIFARTDFDCTLDPKTENFLSEATKAKMRTTDGICVDDNDNIYVADFSNNAVSKVTPKGEISVISQNGDTDGRDGELNEPGEPIVWNGKIIVTNFDAVTGPDKVDSKHDLPATISVLKLK